MNDHVQDGEFYDRVCALRERMIVGEILVKPMREGRADLVHNYEAALGSSAVLLVPFDRQCAKAYAELRQDKTILAPDAVQLSCAVRAQCDMFITNDERLSRKVVPGIHFIVSLERAFL